MNKKKFFIITMSFLLSSTLAFTADSPDWYQFVQSIWVESENARADLLQTSKSEQADARVNSLRTSLDENICLLRSDCVKRVNELKATEAVNVQDYLPENPMLDGSVDYLEQIQKALNENRCVKFTGSDDPVHPLIYGMSSELIVPEGHILLGDAT
ncbi:hypothetical protein GF337_01655, partial [candidate division KSB1 bacterium]|nr:hypothetical protein [candidate division KSB1 bacterium]